MAINNSARATFPPELRALMNGTPVEIGTLSENPVIIMFDNQGTDSIAISTDGGLTTWRTFPGGNAIVLDLRAAHGLAPNYTFDVGTTFTGTGNSGFFSISYTGAKNM